MNRDALLLALSIAGGGVDAVVVLGFHVMTAAQTGNTILLAAAIAEHRFATGLISAVSVVAYVGGCAAGELVIIARRNASSALFAEIVALVALFVVWRAAGPAPGFGVSAILVALAAIAMGMQSAAVLRFHAGPKTTYITGTLTRFATSAVHAFVHDGAEEPEATLRETLYGVDWVVYFVGALATGFLYVAVREIALVIPVAAIAVAVILQKRPD